MAFEVYIFPVATSMSGVMKLFRTTDRENMRGPEVHGSSLFQVQGQAMQ